MFESEYRVLDIRASYLVAEPLDGAGIVKVSVASPQRYIENEILVLSSVVQRRGGIGAQVIASRIDPSFLKLRPLDLERRATDEYELSELPPPDDADAFEKALEVYRAGCYRGAGLSLRNFVRRNPLHIDSYHHLGNLSWKEGRLARAQKYYEMGYRIGLLSLPEGFAGQIPWAQMGNRPFLRATHAYALVLSERRRTLEACKICEQILAWDPQDALAIRDLLPRYYFEARAPDLAHTFLEAWGADGMNYYTLGLLKLIGGRRKEALRCLCAAVTYNPYVPLFLIGERKTPRVIAETEYVTMGGEVEAAEYLHEFARYWRKDHYVDFVRIVMKPDSPFRRRFDRYLDLKEQLDEIRDFPVREQLIAEKQKILDEDDVRALLRESVDMIFG